jgi:(2Fe-2S) ferredoxin
MGKHGGHDLPKAEHLIRQHTACLAICAGKDCVKAGAKHVIHAAEAALDETGLANTYPVVLTKCQDFCDDGPVMTVIPGNLPYIGLSPRAIRQVIVEHLRDGSPVLALLPKKLRHKMQRRQARSEETLGE